MISINENDKILIVRLTALGDTVHTLPLICAIKKQYPNVFIGWAVSEKCKDAVMNNPLIDKIHLISKKKNSLYWNAIREIQKEKYTIAIDSQELFKSGIISFLSGAKYRLAHAQSREFSFIFANKLLKAFPIFDCSRHVIERNMDFARYLGIKDCAIDFVLPKNSVEDILHVKNLLKNIDENKKNIIISPSTTWITKFWSIENWVKVADYFNEKANIIFSGSPADIEYTNKILDLCQNKSSIINLVGKTNIPQLKVLFENADIVITPDSGSAHLASATKKPKIVSLFGATSNVRNGAFGNNINLSADMSCQPCYKKHCPYNEGLPVCMKNISANTVINRVCECLKNE